MTARKQRRRQYGTGSVYQRCDHPTCPPMVPGDPDPVTGEVKLVRPKHKCEGKWIGTIEAGFRANGSRRRLVVSGKTEAEAKVKLKERQRKIDAEGLPSADASARTTVKQFAENWLETTVLRLRPSSYNADRGAVKNWIIPTIGHKRLDALTPGDVRAVAKAQRAAGRTESTALRTHSTLMVMLKAAVLEGHAVPQRVREVERPVASRSDRDALPVPAALAVLEQAAALPHGSRWVAALLQGMRQAEALGLTWELVDLDGKVPTCDISWQLQPLPYKVKRDPSSGFRVPAHLEVRHLEGRMHLTRPKTARGQRIIPLVPPMVTTLRAWREVAPESPYDLVWPAADGRPQDAADDLEEWHNLQQAANVAHPSGRFYGTHEARHTTATLLLEAGVDPEVVKAILGHSSIVTSRLYQHVDKTMTMQAMEKVAERLQLT